MTYDYYAGLINASIPEDLAAELVYDAQSRILDILLTPRQGGG